MQHNNTDWIDQIIESFCKWWVWFAYIFVGMVGKFSYDYGSGKKFSWAKILSSVGIALFVGFISSSICIYNGWTEEARYIVPIATLLSEKLVWALFAVDYKQIMSEIAKYWADKWGKK
jgi:hypothetical protein